MTEQEYLASTDPVAMLDFLNTAASLNGKPWSEWKPSDRKMRLAMCAMSRASAFDSFKLMRRVSLAERWADGEIDREAVVASTPGESTSWCDWVVAHPITRDAVEWASRSYKWVAPFVLREIIGNPFRPVSLPMGRKCWLCDGRGNLLGSAGDKSNPQCDQCHGTGHGPSPILTPLVLSLAQAAYDERRPDGTLDCDTLAVLSDALEEAGCPENAECVACWGKGKIKDRSSDTTWILAFDYYIRAFDYYLPCKLCRSTGLQPNPLLAHLRYPGPHYRGCWALDFILGKE